MATRKWSAGVKTVSTYPEHDLFNQSAETVAKHLASKKVSPKGPASGMRMLNFYINRAGKNLPEARHKELEKAKELLSKIIQKKKRKGCSKSGCKESPGEAICKKSREETVQESYLIKARMFLAPTVDSRHAQALHISCQ